MTDVKSLKDIIQFNNSFKTAVNLYLSLNKSDKVESYIPTNSSVNILNDYLLSVERNKEQATLLVGPYGKGKSHLLLVLLAILSMDRNEKNNEVIANLVNKVNSVEGIQYDVGNLINKVWNDKKYLPIIISNTSGDLNQAFIYALNEALKREGLENVSPDTFYTIAIDRINDWKNNYSDTYGLFVDKLSDYNTSVSSLIADLIQCKREALYVFKSIYPQVTAGSEFNPMVVSEVLPLYKNVAERLVEDHNYNGMFIVFDEFSKFIESQDGKSSGNNMKLLQDICELSTESQDAKIFFTMVTHKSIKEYGKYLSADIINSFTGIEGRIVEKYFITSSKNNYELVKNAIIKDVNRLIEIPDFDSVLGESALDQYYSLPAFKSKFQKDDFENLILKGCYPLNPIAAYLLLNVSEKVAQNERTLFTFISNDEPHSLARLVNNHSNDQSWSIGADAIYDYFETIFRKDINNEFVHNIWLSAQYALQSCKDEYEKKIIKSLAIVLIVNKEDEIPANEKYLTLTTKVDDINLILDNLKKRNLIYKKGSTASFVFKTRAGIELKSEIKKQRELRGDSIDYSSVLLDVLGNYHVIPRKYNTVNFMTRYYTNQFMDVSDFLNITSSSSILSNDYGDGKIVMLYSFSKFNRTDIEKHFIEIADPKLILVCPRKIIKSKKLLIDYDIMQSLRKNQYFTDNNEILKNELPLLMDDITTELISELTEIYEEGNSSILYFDNDTLKEDKYTNIESVVGYCCDKIYYKTSLINNEMINRTVITTAQTKKARAIIVDAILRHIDNEEFYVGSRQEATIYRSLIINTGLANKTHNQNLEDAIAEINNFIDSCSGKKVSLAKLIKLLTDEPYGMRLGVVPVYLAYAFSKRKEDLIVYFINKELQLDNNIVINMCENPTDYYLYISKEDAQKEKYINELNMLFDVDANKNLSTNRIKNILTCMQRWFRALPQISRNMICIDEYVLDKNISFSMKALKRILNKVDNNPFEVLFETLPKDFGVNSLEETFNIIDQCKTNFDDYYDWIQNLCVDIIYDAWESKRKDLYHLLKDWYEKQSNRSKQGLYSAKMTLFMSVIESLNVFNDSGVANKIAKAVTDVYLEDWDSNTLEDFKSSIKDLKDEIENITDINMTGEYHLSFIGKDGQNIEKLYSHAEEGTGSILRNILEDTLEEFDDLSVNDRVSILLEMIEKIIKL